MQAAIVTPPPSRLATEVLRVRAMLERDEFAQGLAAAEKLAAEAPDDRDVLYLIAVGLRYLQRVPEALAVLERLERLHPAYPRIYQERGHCHVALRSAQPAIAAYERAVTMSPALHASWRALQSLYRMTGRLADAERADAQVAALAALPHEIVTAFSMYADGEIFEAERVVRQYLLTHGDHVEGMRLLAKIGIDLDVADDAELLLAKALELAPEHRDARYEYAIVLLKRHKHVRAREEMEKLLAVDPGNRMYRTTHATICIGFGDYEALPRYRELLAETPNDPELHLSIAHALKTLGQTPEAIESYRAAAVVRPDFGEAYWSLANLKTYRFTDAELDRMRAVEASPQIQLADRYHLCFALGKALEDLGEYSESFAYYERGNALKKIECRYRPEPLERTARLHQALCSAEFFASRAGYGSDSNAPIFIVGLPRSGSTLIEQILASHSEVEGTMELADIPRLVQELQGRETLGGEPRYPGILAAMSADQFRELGERYLRDTRIYRTGKPRFIDKMPNNFRHLALIHLMLPNARIIDARREAMACCFSNFKQLFASGQQFTYSIEDIARYYRMYVELMAHFDRALPGRILRIQHEAVVGDLEGSVRRILDFCGLSFEPACLEFHKTARSVHSASSEQVRRPINREGVDQWRHYEPWLGSLKSALGPLAAGERGRRPASGGGVVATAAATGAPVNGVEREVQRLRAMLEKGEFAAALADAEMLLARVPENRDVLYVVAVAQRYLKRIPDALATLARCESLHPGFSRLYQERGHCHLAARNPGAALESFLKAVQINVALPASWKALDVLFRAAGRQAESQNAAAQVRRLAGWAPEVLTATGMFADGETHVAEQIIRRFLLAHPTHVEAMRLLAQIGVKLDVLDDAEFLLESALLLAPDYPAMRYEYAVTLLRRHKHVQALVELDRLLAADPGNRAYRITHATACVGLGRHEEAIERYRSLLADSPGAADLHLSIAHALKTLGRQKEAIDSYRAAYTAQPGFGDAYWSLANLKTYRFTDAELALMRAQERRPDLSLVDRYHLCFALGKALEDRGEFAESFAYYQDGNAQKKSEIRFTLEPIARNAALQPAVCAREFFAARAGCGCAAPDPIFIVGLPRAGSTLLEQILASHSEVEGTTELPEILRLVGELQGRDSDPIHPRYPAVLAELDVEDFRRFGEKYLADTRIHRSGKPRFIDKMPNNFRHIGLIHLILPNARIIDARREPMACCFSNFKQLFASGQEFTYSLEDIARYYRIYVELMRHWDAVLPGKVLRVDHEDVVEDLEGNVRRILDFCGLEFEPACLEFHKTERSVRTASSEQVRQPIYKEGLEQWRNFEPWLGELKRALGPLATGA